MDPYIGEIRLFAFTFAPSRWAVCDGSLLPIAQNQALFSLLGTIYGGDGITTFALPDLRGRLPIGSGAGAGLPPLAQGQSGGAASITLTAANLPPHNHTVGAASTATSKSPAGAVPSVTSAGSSYGTTADLAMSPTLVGGGGSSQPFDNHPPFLALNWCIALQGIFPPRS